MAIGAITVNSRNGHAGRPIFWDTLTFVGDAAYPTGGTAAFQAAFRTAVARGTQEIIAVHTVDCGGYTVSYDKDNDKLKVYYVDNNNASDGPQIEVPNTTNLSAVTFKVLVQSF